MRWHGPTSHLPPRPRRPRRHRPALPLRGLLGQSAQRGCPRRGRPAPGLCHWPQQVGAATGRAGRHPACPAHPRGRQRRRRRDGVGLGGVDGDGRAWPELGCGCAAVAGTGEAAPACASWKLRGSLGGPRPRDAQTPHQAKPCADWSLGAPVVATPVDADRPLDTLRTLRVGPAPARYRVRAQVVEFCPREPTAMWQRGTEEEGLGEWGTRGSSVVGQGARQRRGRACMQLAPGGAGELQHAPLSAA